MPRISSENKNVQTNKSRLLYFKRGAHDRNTMKRGAWVVALKKVCDEEFSNIFSCPRFLIFRSNFWLVVACVENVENAGGFFEESFARPKL